MYWTLWTQWTLLLTASNDCEAVVCLLFLILRDIKLQA